ncbi:jg15592 [Pararge aegeria aegeria]|uniref:Jg15592 protein n=1 Tax=Pararge aegeria aegeria TaxID=348720 RepID=A0A8S4RU24_9NEOP|nr:jg15592 [Pararge aegeria aegeria]
MRTHLKFNIVPKCSYRLQLEARSKRDPQFRQLLLLANAFLTHCELPRTSAPALSALRLCHHTTRLANLIHIAYYQTTTVSPGKTWLSSHNEQTTTAPAKSGSL